ncbi:hypothetical protein [Salininema proteolyticum]|uniref:CDP-diacylglycerol--glycerol-3-phosphate 3-phosphatidyltransferase n=1 Tax=Salininema proteolyticum TaxID=1607685 RepID=A0ABV8U0A3_9ACTN
MRTRVPADSLLGRAILSSRVPPWSVLAASFAASAAIPAVALTTGAPLALLLPLMGVVIIADVSFGLLATNVEKLSRRLLFFEPLVARLGEAGWLLALWHFGAPGWVIALTCGTCWVYVQSRHRARQLGLRQLGMTTLAERNVRTTTVGLAFVAIAVISIAGSSDQFSWIQGVATIAATAWMLLSSLGLLQLMVVAASALRER